MKPVCLKVGTKQVYLNLAGAVAQRDTAVRQENDLPFGLD